MTIQYDENGVEFDMTARISFKPNQFYPNLDWQVDIFDDGDLVDDAHFSTKDECLEFCYRWQYEVKSEV